MESYEIAIIRRAFARCYGLQDALTNYAEKQNREMVACCLDSLARQTGMRKDALDRNLNIIINL